MTPFRSRSSHLWNWVWVPKLQKAHSYVIGQVALSLRSSDWPFTLSCPKVHSFPLLRPEKWIFTSQYVGGIETQGFLRGFLRYENKISYTTNLVCERSKDKCIGNVMWSPFRSNEELFLVNYSSWRKFTHGKVWNDKPIPLQFAGGLRCSWSFTAQYADVRVLDWAALLFMTLMDQTRIFLTSYYVSYLVDVLTK